MWKGHQVEGPVPLSCDSQTSVADYLEGRAPLPEFDSRGLELTFLPHAPR